MEMLKSRAGLQMTHIPYKGAAPALADLVHGVYQVKVDAYITANGFVQSGKLKLYAVTSAQRMEQLPNVPTVAESGYPGFESTYWIGIVAPSATPAPIRAKLEKAFMQAIHDKDVSAKLIATGTRPIGSTATVLDQRIKRELTQWPVILRDAGIKEH
jgi:tripartite-type tricarboxylate transporter receptor subunit TctC